MTRATRIAVVLAVAGCSGRASVEPPAPVPIEDVETLPAGVHWVRNSAEYRALVRQTFVLATERIRTLSAGRATGTWAVIIDADETILDNSEYNKRLAITGTVYEEDSWAAWAREESAPPVPGAIAFLDTVAALGGRIAIVTNRPEAVCDATRQNLRNVRAHFDVVLCRPPSSGDKNPRFAAVANGSAAPGMPPLAVLLWIGDDIQDFPAATQDLRSRGPDAFAAFGRNWIILPNPMYGSWTRNPRR